MELWSEQECFFDVSSHFYHNKVEREKKWTEITEAPEIPGEFTTRLCCSSSRGQIEAD